jgi:putative spermidine/putrescine transport system permease protein
MIQAALGRRVLATYVAVFLALVALPILVVVLVSFSPTPFLTIPMSSLSLQWYHQVWEYTPFIDGLIVSLKLAIASSLAGALLAVPCALALARQQRRWATLTVSFMLSPISIPGVVLGFALLYFLSARAIGPGFLALFIAHTAIAIPYIGRTVLSVYRTISPSVEESAIVLGASRLRTLLHVTLPQLRPAIFSGMLFACLISIDNLAISYFFGTAQTNVLPVVMLSYLQNQYDPSIAAIATLQMVLAILALLVGNAMTRKNKVRAL